MGFSVQSSNTGLANSSEGWQTSLLLWLYGSCFELYICYEEVFRCLFQKQPTILP